MTTIERTIRDKIQAESTLRPAQRTQPVPCAFCVRGGNGDGSCGSGGANTRYNKFQGCFAGELKEEAHHG